MVSKTYDASILKGTNFQLFPPNVAGSPALPGLNGYPLLGRAPCDRGLTSAAHLEAEARIPMLP